MKNDPIAKKIVLTRRQERVKADANLERANAVEEQKVSRNFRVFRKITL